MTDRRVRFFDSALADLVPILATTGAPKTALHLISLITTPVALARAKTSLARILEQQTE